MLHVYRFLWPLILGWLLACCLYKEVNLQIFKWVFFWLHGCCEKWEVWARKPVNHTSLVAVVTPTDHPKLVRNRWVIDLFVALLVLSLWPFDISAGVGAFVIGLSKISSFFSSSFFEVFLNNQFFIIHTTHFPLNYKKRLFLTPPYLRRPISKDLLIYICPNWA